MRLALRRDRIAAPHAEPNVIPFIDVLLVLLIIFMVTAPKPTTDLKIDLGHNRDGPTALITPLVLDLRHTPHGVRAFIGNQSVPLTDLPAQALIRVLVSNPALTPQQALETAPVLVRADLDLSYQSVVSAVDALKTGHFERVTFVTPTADAEP